MPRSFLKFSLDLLAWSAAAILSFWLRLEDPLPLYARPLLLYVLLGAVVGGLVIAALGLPQQAWNKAGLRDAFAVFWATALGTGFLFLIVGVGHPDFGIPRSIPLIHGALALLFLGGLRAIVRMAKERSGRRALSGRERRVLIVGAGEAGTMIAREMLRHPETGLTPVGFLDDDPNKAGQRYLGLRVLGKLGDLPRVVRHTAAEEVLIAIPSAPGTVVRRVVDLARKAGVRYRIIPGIYDILADRVSVTQIREVDVEDLLRRDPVRLQVEEIAGYLEGKVILVTGAGGSIGSEIVRQVLPFRPKFLVLVGRGENSLYELEKRLEREYPSARWATIVADVRRKNKLISIFERFRPQVVFHAAAHKHVPLMELNPDEAIFNNVGGTKNLVEVSLRFGVERLVNISTDKAVNPTSIMGASKRVAEHIVTWAASRARLGQVFVSVRFGNVLGSRGSVIPLFKEQIRRGGPVTITHPDMVRYFMTIPEAAQLVLQAGGLGENGAVYVLDMGEPVRVLDLAYDLIRLSGLEPHVDIDIVFTGKRPGEKLFEELLTAEEGTRATKHEKIFVARNTDVSPDFEEKLHALFEAARTGNGDAIHKALRELVPTYNPASFSGEDGRRLENGRETRRADGLGSSGGDLVVSQAKELLWPSRNATGGT